MHDEFKIEARRLIEDRLDDGGIFPIWKNNRISWANRKSITKALEIDDAP